MMVPKRRAFTLIELLVVLAIIGMIMAIAAPSVLAMLKQARTDAATDILRAAASRTWSTAISTRRSCNLDISYTEDDSETEKLSSSVTMVSDDFERYPEGVKRIDELTDRWVLRPEPQPHNTGNTWQIAVDQTHELRAGRGTADVGDSYIYSMDTASPSDPAIDGQRTVAARFKLRRINPSDREGTWGFGLLAHFVKDRRKLVGYRFCVVARTDSHTGQNETGRAVLQKLYSPSNPNSENCSEATGPGSTGSRDLDTSKLTAIVSPGVWYRLKFDVKREDGAVTITGKIWVDGSPEPEAITVGPAYDASPGAELPEGATDSFQYDALAGGFCGAWVAGGEIAVDDFAAYSTEYVPLPDKIQIKAVRPASGRSIDDADFDPDVDLVELEPYEPGGFPITYRADGTTAADSTVFVRITDVPDGNRRHVRIDPDTGRIDLAE